MNKMTQEEQLNVELNLTLTVGDVNTLLAAAGQMPHDQVRGTIDKVMNQASPQLEKALREAEEVGEPIATATE